MDMMLQNGDFVIGTGGVPCTVDGTLELAQRALFRLTVRKGAFPLDPELGSQLYKLRDVKKPYWQESALLWAKEALTALPQVQAEAVEVNYSYEKQAILLDIRLKISGMTQTVVMTV